MIRRAVQSGVKDAAPDLTPEPRRDTPDERSIEMESSARTPEPCDCGCRSCATPEGDYWCSVCYPAEDCAPDCDERADCDKTGEVGHWQCGRCPTCSAPTHHGCSCIVVSDRPKETP